MGLSLKGSFVCRAYESKLTQNRQAYILRSHNLSTILFVEVFMFRNTLHVFQRQHTWRIWLSCFQETLTVRATESKRNLAIFTAVLHYNISDDSSWAQHNADSAKQGHETSEWWGSHCSISTRTRLEEIQASKVPWNDRVLEPTEDGVEAHRKQEAARKTAFPHTPGHEELSSSHACKFHVCGTVAVDPSQGTTTELKQHRFLDHKGRSTNDWRWSTGRQHQSVEYLTLVAHATCAIAVVYTSSVLSIICLDEIHLWDGWIHLMVYQWSPRQIAEVRKLQSHLHSVIGRSASSDLSTETLLSKSEHLGEKHSSLYGELR